jgi:SAM-dependent methyltransferase
MSSDVERFVRFCDSEFGKSMMKKEVEYVYNELRSCEKILDVGCGIGSFEQDLPSLNIVGLDSSEEMLEEARKRSDKIFVLGNAEHMNFKDSIFDAVFTVTSLEFLDDYQKAVREIARVTRQHGKILAMTLNPESEYFRREMKKPGDYFRRIKHTDLREIRDYISQFFVISKEDYFLGIRGQRVFDTNDQRYASLRVVVGTKTADLNASVRYKVQNDLHRMARSSRAQILLKVPFYRQRFDFTCGAASLMMAMKYFDPSLKLTKNLEIDIWRETNLVEDRSTCGRGLAYSAAKRGFEARIVASVDDIPFKEKILKISPGADLRVLEFFFRDMQKRALALDVKEERRKVTIKEISSALERGEVPIVLINAILLHREDVPHWVVVRGYNRREIFIHDPLWKAPQRGGVAVQRFNEMIGYGAGQVMIALSARLENVDL